MRFRYTMHMSTKWCLTGTTSCIVSLASIHTIKPSAMQPRLINKRNKKKQTTHKRTDIFMLWHFNSQKFVSINFYSQI